MLTTTVAGRTINYSHTVGRNIPSGNGFQFPVSLALGKNSIAYVLCRSNEQHFSAHATKVNIGDPGDEEIIAEFGSWGQGDGQMNWPAGLALDKAENVYISDEWLNRVTRYDSEGKFRQKWGTPGSGDGELNRPSGLAFDSQENLYVVDSMNHRVQRFSKDGKFLGKWGSFGSGPGQFSRPWGITVDGKDEVYVADWENHRVQKFSADGAFLAQYGHGPGSGTGELDHPTDVAVDEDGDVYVVDWPNNRVQIYDSSGEFLTSLIGDSQQLSKWAQMVVDANPDFFKARRRVPSLAPEWRFCMPTGIAYEPATRRIMVADTQRGRLQIYVKEKNYADPQANL